MPGGGFTRFAAALDLWNRDSGTAVSLGYAGTTSATAGFGGADGLNVIVFDDPHGEIGGSFSCTQGGILAIGGFYVGGTRTWRDDPSWKRIAEGAIVTQNGAGCFFAGHGGLDGEEVFAHEVGHTLGLGHSSEMGALMFPFAHGDGRGASALHADDVAGLRWLYESRLALCTVIPSLPHTITAQGRYCLDKNLATSVPSGAAITVASDFVTLDMRGFKIGGGGAGAGTMTYGVHARNRKNVIVKNGNIRGFRRAVFLEDDTPGLTASQGHLVENVRVDDNTEAGIWVMGPGSVVRRNMVVNTGWAGTIADTFGILVDGAAARVLDNEVTDTVGTGAGSGRAIAVARANGAVIEKNRLGNASPGAAYGVRVGSGSNVLVIDNRFAALTFGVKYEAGSGGAFRRNLTHGVGTPFSGGTNAGQNQ
jgi:hypothetical protein